MIELHSCFSEEREKGGAWLSGNGVGGWFIVTVLNYKGIDGRCWGNYGSYYDILVEI